jgi:anhydro-N-acetylmuramic acid kinase
VAAGGQGAPFAPLYHQALAVRDHKLPVAVVNCGGIANITIIQDADESGLLAFDTGPGNGLIDRLIRQRTQGREGMDRDGHYGLQGKVCEKTLAALFAKSLMQEGKNYFELSPPKALDIGDMVLIPELETLSLEDACATLEVFTAESIVRSLKLVNIPIPQHWILAGGGWHNPVILRELKSRLGSGIQVMTADEAGWNSQAMEAQIFAYLAVRSLEKKPLSLPGTTRVPAPMTGGELYLPTG